jgi:hypothetical protein
MTISCYKNFASTTRLTRLTLHSLYACDFFLRYYIIMHLQIDLLEEDARLEGRSRKALKDQLLALGLVKGKKVSSDGM